MKMVLPVPQIDAPAVRIERGRNVSAPLETGNPVFDYRADFRRRATVVQALLIRAGLLVFVASGILWLTTAAVSPQWTGGAAIGGAGCVFAGLVWGFYWRNSMREEFQRKFGTDLSPQRHGDGVRK